MQQSSFLIFPCVKGHFSRPVIEAGFLGKVALASQLQPLEELIVNLKTGFLLNPKSPIDWAVIIEMLTEKPQAMETISLQARLRCLELFSLKKQIKIIEKIYQN
jgi:glycosyltransferase involved in cell wall biosynthesis